MLGYATETSMGTVPTLLHEFSVLAEGFDVHTNDFCCQWHYVLVGGRDFGWMNIWGLQPEWLNSVGCKPVWTSDGKTDSFGQRPSRFWQVWSPCLHLTIPWHYAWQLRKTIGLPQGSFCRLGRFGASNLDRPAISRRFRQRPQGGLVQLSKCPLGFYHL